MFQGFYNLTSGVLTQTRNLNVISNNMSNVSTPGYKSDQFVARTFQEELIYRSGNKDKSGAVPIGSMSRIVAADRNYTDYTQEGQIQTTSTLDFALGASGFFNIQGEGGTVYTRNGSFSLDDQGYLCLQGIGRVLGTNGAIYLGTDQINVDTQGNIYAIENGAFMGRLQVTDFDNYDETLTKATGGVFIADGQGRAVNGNITQNALEGSNADPIKEMTRMMSSQRALQSSSQVLKIYDQLIGKAVTQLGPT